MRAFVGTMVRGVVALGLVAGSLLAVAPVAHAASGETAFTFQSALGDVIGRGASASFTAPASTFLVTGLAGPGYFQAIVNPFTGDDWRLRLEAPFGEQLQPGTYRDVQREPGFGHAGLDVSHTPTGCNVDFGSFTITAISSDQYGTIDSIAFTFTQHCETADAPALTGRFAYHAPPAAAVALDTPTPSVVADQPLNLTAIVANPTGGSVTFSDGAAVLATAPVDGDGFAHWSTTSLPVGEHALTASYHGVTSTPVAQRVFDRTNSFWFSSPGGEWVGANTEQSYAAPDATFSVRGNASKLTVSVRDGLHFWDVVLAAAPRKVLRVGTYVNVQRAAFRQPGHPGLDVGGDGRGCNRLSGQFTITQLHTSGSRIKQLAATFVQYCELPNTPPLTGSVRFNAA